MRPRVSAAASVLVSMSFAFAAPLQDFEAFAEDIPDAVAASPNQPAASVGAPRDLQLEVFINGTSRELIAAFRQDPDGALAIQPDQLRNVGIDPAEEAMRPDGLIDIARLPGISSDVRRSKPEHSFYCRI